MTSVLDHNDKEIALRNCVCGAEPEYFSKCGLAHEIVCRSCGRQTDIERTGMDAVHEWNHGTVYRTRKDAPLISQFCP